MFMSVHLQIFVATLLLVIFCIGCSSKENDINGSMVVHDARLSGIMGEPCHLQFTGYDDIRGGTPVVLRDETGAVIATSYLREGEYTWAPAVWQPEGPFIFRDAGDPTWGSCIFRFTLPAVPESEFYEFEIGRRGRVVHSHAEMESFFWDILFSLGGP